MNTIKPILYLILALIVLVLYRVSPYWPIPDGSFISNLIHSSYWMAISIFSIYAIALTIKAFRGVRKQSKEIGVFFLKYSLDAPGITKEQMESKIRSISIDKDCPQEDRDIACQMIQLYDKIYKPDSE